MPKATTQPASSTPALSYHDRRNPDELAAARFVTEYQRAAWTALTKLRPAVLREIAGLMTAWADDLREQAEAGE